MSAYGVALYLVVCNACQCQDGKSDMQFVLRLHCSALAPVVSD